MKTHIILLVGIGGLSLAACSSESTSGPGSSATGGTGASAGLSTSPTAGASPASAGANSGGAPAGGAAGSSAAGATQAGGGSFGGSPVTAGGAAGTAGSPSGGTGGSAGAAGSSGAAGSPGAGGSVDIAQALDGLRVDDACSGTADTSVGAVCPHVTLTASGGSKYAKSATIAGAAGTVYDVTLRIRGVVEPTSITGGMRSDSGTFQYRSMDWRKVPYTVGGAVANSTDADYTQWHIAVDSPKGDFYLNDYQKTGHYIFKLDYQVTIPMASNAKVTLDGTDRNERQIVNYEKYAIDGISGSMNFGQFVQVNVVSVKPR